MFRHLSIRARLLGLMTLATAAVCTVGGSALLNMRAANRASTELVAAGHAVRASMQADMLHDAVHAQVMAAALAALRGDAAGLKAAAEAVDADTAELQANIARAAELSPNARAAEAARTAVPTAQAYAAAAKKFVEAARLNPQGMAAEQASFEKTFEALKVALEASGDGILGAADAIADEAAQDSRRNALLTVIAIVGAVGLLTLGLIWVVGSISRSVRGILEAVERLNRDEQDLSVRLPPATGEFRRITDGMNRFLDRVAHTVGGMRAGAEDILQARGQIAAGNQHLAERTDHATSGLQQTASSVEQITRTIAQSADAARQADALARSAADVAERGGEVVERVVHTMGEIDASARKIADITGVIDGIAFQTNILALNAAVEAARAGEQGRGFAVVASEVRMLAQRSAEAAREIKALIGSSVERVESGTALAGDAGRTMQEIVGSVRRVSDMIAEVTHAADEQNSGIGLVNQAVVELDRITQQNATLVQETAAAAQQMNDRASELARTVGALQARESDAAVAA